MPRILHIFRSMQCGGAETAIMNVYRAIRHLGVQFDFAVCGEQKAFYDDEIHRLGGRIFPIRDPKVDGLRVWSQGLRRVIVDQGPFDGLHSHVHFFSGVVLRLADQMGIPKRIAHSHTVEYTSARGWRRSAYRWLMRRLILKHATQLLGASKAACDDLFGPENPRSQVLLNGIDPSRYCGGLGDKTGARRKLGIPMDRILIGHAGRFEEVKNHEFVVRVFQEIAETEPSAHLVLFGDGSLRPRTEDRVGSLGLGPRVTFAGTRSDLASLLPALDLFLFPSRYEGLGLAAVEAQAAGVPCVLARSVPAEADLGIGLACFLGLDEAPAVWASTAMRMRLVPPPACEERESALSRKGLDIAAVSRAFVSVYCSPHAASGAS